MIAECGHLSVPARLELRSDTKAVAILVDIKD
jgi:hypothetical protein